jgi:hypothetical protein
MTCPRANRVLPLSACVAFSAWLGTSVASAQDLPEAPTATDPVSAEAALDAQRAELEALRADMAALRAEMDASRSEPAVHEAPGPDASPGTSGERIAFGSEARVEADEVVDDVVAYGEDVVVEGRVLGNATSFGGDVLILDEGVVEGDAVSFGGEVRVDEDATVDGDRVALSSASEPDGVRLDLMFASLYHRLVFLLSFAGVGVLVVGLFPSRVGRIALSLEAQPITAGLLGTLGTVVLGGAGFAFFLTCAGAPITLVLVGLLGVAWLMGFVGLCQAIGDRLPFQQKQHGRWLAFLVGAVLLSFLGSLPWIGVVIVVLASLLGVGASIRTRFGAR